MELVVIKIGKIKLEYLLPSRGHASSVGAWQPATYGDEFYNKNNELAISRLCLDGSTIEGPDNIRSLKHKDTVMQNNVMQNNESEGTVSVSRLSDSMFEYFGGVNIFRAGA